jgi:hypothetical protein
MLKYTQTFQKSANWCIIFDKPTFKEWLFGIKRVATFDLKVKDLLLNPPKDEIPTKRIYEIKPK